MEVFASQPSSKTEELQMPEEGRFAPTGSRSFNFQNPGEGSPAGDPHSNARLLQDDRRLAFNRQSSFKQTSSASPISIIPNVSSKPYLARSLSSNNSFNQQLHRPSLFSPRLLDPSRQSFAEEGQYWKGNVERVEKVCPRSRLSRHESFPHSESFIGMFMAAFDIIISGSRPMKRLCTLIMLNVAYSTIELLLGLLTGRVGLVSDAFHLSFGCGVLSFSLIAMVVAKKKPDDVFTYGYKRVEVLSAFTNALFLLFLSFSLAVEALHAFVQDESEHKHYLIVSAVANLLVNVLGVWFFRGYARVQIVYRKAEDMNHHSICLHVLSDSIRSAGLILASWLLTLGVKNAEMLCLSLVSAIVFIMVLPLFKATGGILLQTAPSGVSSSAFNKCLRQVNAIEDVSEVSQVRFWELVPGYLVGQMLLQIKKGCDEYRILKHIHSLYSDIGVKDLTVQTEFV